MKYNFVITETLRKIVRVEAETEDEAYDKVQDLYTSEDIVLTADDFVDNEFESLGYFNDDTSLSTDETYPVDIDFTETEE
jgi:hypothetical protein